MAFVVSDGVQSKQFFRQNLARVGLYTVHDRMPLTAYATDSRWHPKICLRMHLGWCRISLVFGSNKAKALLMSIPDGQAEETNHTHKAVRHQSTTPMLNK